MEPQEILRKFDELILEALEHKSPCEVIESLVRSRVAYAAEMRVSGAFDDHDLHVRLAKRFQAEQAAVRQQLDGGATITLPRKPEVFADKSLDDIAAVAPVAEGSVQRITMRASPEASDLLDKMAPTKKPCGGCPDEPDMARRLL